MKAADWDHAQLMALAWPRQSLNGYGRVKVDCSQTWHPSRLGCTKQETVRLGDTMLGRKKFYVSELRVETVESHTIL